jgi:hypothetical protein
MTQAQIQTQTQQHAGQIVFLNALPLSIFPRSIINISIIPVSLRDLAEWTARRVKQGYIVVHYIRHAGTVAVLRALGIPLDERPNADIYRYQRGDLLVVVSLRTPPRGQDVVNVSPQDLDAWVVSIS